MPKYASFSQDATRLLREKTGSGTIECYIYIDVEQDADSFVLLRYPQRIVQIGFNEIAHNPADFSSLIDGIYNVMYN